MLPEERRLKILELLKKERFLSTERLSALLFSSPATIRRDLSILSENGQIQRTRGGAMYLGEQRYELPFLYRERNNEPQKEYVSELALAHIEEGQSLFLDSSSTVFKLAKKLHTFKNLKILTNGNLTSYILGVQTTHDIYSVGGKIRNKESSITGVMACDHIRSFYADTAIVSCRGLSLHGGSDATEEESQVKRAFFKQAKKTILLVDSSKIEQDFFYLSVPFEKIDLIISDIPLPSTFQNMVDKHQVEVIY
ncbi:DeoR/GlpR transcriptional regulator [Vagococcus sp. BWB3-3]|uniref:DeoR/GlpR transcriptional regulator n=1 Tax=Vagococcus allomyrinae TaxID=2794353 RepID=A0A940SSS9_9ENTE|nr:DeoR/GlpR family DNA-binding transcription regulator [Vagococcus allomyrinae]MBP1039570.1 DeoR/GlpR transcriptional regulator [Vagococcus allomyrinae]